MLETRIIDLVTPIGKGNTRIDQAALPRTGKTTILKQIANSVTANHPDVHVLVLLIDERPEEVTDFLKRSVKGYRSRGIFERPGFGNPRPAFRAS